MTDLTWEEPPGAHGQGRQSWHSVADQLREHPEQWAHIATTPGQQKAYSLASNIKRGRYVAFRPGGAFDAVTRTVQGEHRVYARYVGDAES